MSPRALRMVAVASVLLNVAFAAGFLQARLAARRASAAVGAGGVATKLRLTPSQSTLFSRLRAEASREAATLGAAEGRLLPELWSEIARPQPDPEAVATRVAELVEARARFERRVVELVSELVVQLRPDQKSAFLEILLANDPFRFLRDRTER